MRAAISRAGLLVWAVLLLIPAFTVAVRAQTVADIVSHGTIKVGVNTGAPPFDQIDSHGNPVGYDVDVANLMGKYLGVSVQIVPLASAARIPALEAGRVDVLVAALSPTPDRARTVAFTMPYCSFDLAIFAPKSMNLKNVADLKGHSVGFNRGTSQERFVAQLTAQSTTVQRYDDVALTVQALLSHQVDAVAIPVTMGQDIIHTRPQAGVEEKFVFFSQPNSIAVRRDAGQFLQWLNNFVYFIKQDGELDAISRKWIGAPLPNLPVF